MRAASGRGADWWAGFAPGDAARVANEFAQAQRGTRARRLAGQMVCVIFRPGAALQLRKTFLNSNSAAVGGPCGGSIRKNIIGHGRRSVGAGFLRGQHVWRPSSAIALLEEPAREHGGGVLLYPLIDQGLHFLAEMGGVRQARQFKILQGVPRSGKKKLPRRLGRPEWHRASVKGRRPY